ncbi:unnamed protein product [Arctia plantaginis]|uniref:Uncharacterized protein n=1 Tax=Arctia plantaginis TaxID=874455 RepID=A0A8S0ZFL7_ARCPL|nr:unnamed protein product [Arctia plantaginis]
MREAMCEQDNARKRQSAKETICERDNLRKRQSAKETIRERDYLRKRICERDNLPKRQTATDTVRFANTPIITPLKLLQKGSIPDVLSSKPSKNCECYTDNKL